MKIKINGDLKRTEKNFVCEFCGCSFIADATEYNVDYEYRSTKITQIKIKCPCCHAPVIYTDESNIVPSNLQQSEVGE